MTFAFSDEEQIHREADRHFSELRDCGFCGEPAPAADAFCSSACREAWWLDSDDKRTMPFARRPEWR